MELTTRQQELADAALQIVARGGLAAVSFRAVAAEAGCSLGSVQKAFPSKAVLLSAAFSRLRERATSLPPGEPGRPRLRKWLVDLFLQVMPLDAERRLAQRQGDAFAQWALDEPAAAEAIARSDAHIRRLLASLVDRARDEGELSADVDPQMVAWAVLALATGMAQQLLYDPLPEPQVREQFDSAVGALLAGGPHG